MICKRLYSLHLLTSYPSWKPDSEVAGCISDIGIPFSISDLQKPNSQQIQRVFEWFAELLMNITRESVSPAMKAAADDTCGQFTETFSNDTSDLMGFFVVLRKLLVEVGWPFRHLTPSETLKELPFC